MSARFFLLQISLNSLNEQTNKQCSQTCKEMVTKRKGVKGPLQENESLEVPKQQLNFDVKLQNFL